MPPIHFWFTGAALYLAGSFAFAIVVGLIGIKDMIPKRILYALLAVALVLSGLAWRTAARQELDANDQAQKAALLNQQIQELTKSNAEIKEDMVLEQKELHSITDQNNGLIGSLSSIAKTVGVDPSQAIKSLVDKIVEKLNALQTQIAELKRLGRLDNHFYEDGKDLAAVDDTKYDQESGVLNIGVMTAESGFTFSKEIEFQRVRLLCDSKEPNVTARMGANSTMTYYDVTCHVLGVIK